MKRNQVRQAMWAGAKRGALFFGLLGFLTGVSICIAYHLPIPPIAVTELGVLFGGCFGAFLGYARLFRLWRCTLWGALAGAVAGAVSLNWAVCLGCLVVGSFLGYQRGSLPEVKKESWRLH